MAPAGGARGTSASHGACSRYGRGAPGDAGSAAVQRTPPAVPQAACGGSAQECARARGSKARHRDVPMAQADLRAEAQRRPDGSSGRGMAFLLGGDRPAPRQEAEGREPAADPRNPRTRATGRRRTPAKGRTPSRAHRARIEGEAAPSRPRVAVCLPRGMAASRRTRGMPASRYGCLALRGRCTGAVTPACGWRGAR